MMPTMEQLLRRKWKQGLYAERCYRDLNGCTILGFCGNKLFILDPHYDEQYASDSEEYAKCKEIVTSIKKSFISYIKDAGTVE